MNFIIYVLDKMINNDLGLILLCGLGLLLFGVIVYICIYINGWLTSGLSWKDYGDLMDKEKELNKRREWFL